MSSFGLLEASDVGRTRQDGINIDVKGGDAASLLSTTSSRHLQESVMTSARRNPLNSKPCFANHGV